MDSPHSSLLSSLGTLTDTGRDRAREEHKSRIDAERKKRVASLVATNRERRELRERKNVARRERALAAQRRREEEARERGREAAADSCRRIAEEHAERMREMAVVHDVEHQHWLERQDARSRRFRVFSAVTAAAWLMAVVVFATKPPEGHREVAQTTPTSLVGEAAPPAPMEHVPAMVVATAELEATSRMTRRPPTRATRTPAKPAPTTVPKPPPTPVPTGPMCDDTRGDPCCAFGEIVC